MWVSKTGTSHGPSGWVVIKSGSGAVLPLMCLQTVSSSVLFINVLCTTSINRNYRTFRMSSFLFILDRAIELY